MLNVEATASRKLHLVLSNEIPNKLGCCRNILRCLAGCYIIDMYIPKHEMLYITAILKGTNLVTYQIII